MRALDTLGLATQVQEAGADIQMQSILSGKGKTLAQVDTEDFWGDCGPCVSIRRSHLHELLIEELGHLPVHFSTTIKDISGIDGSPLVLFSDGNTQEFDIVRARLAEPAIDHCQNWRGAYTSGPGSERSAAR